MKSPDLALTGALPLRIRPMYLEESGTVLNLICLSIRADRTTAYSPHQIKKLLRVYCRLVDSPGIVIVAESESRIVGVAKASFRLFRIQLIEAVFTHPDFVGRGVGTALVAELERMAKLRNVSKVIVYAAVAATGFYQKLSYQHVGSVRILRGVDCIVMEKRLKAHTLFDSLSGLLLVLLISMVVFAILYGLVYFAYYLLIHRL